MNNYPKISKAIAIKPYKIKVTFNNNTTKLYNFEYLLNLDDFYLLKDYSFFESFKISSGGYGLEWNDEIDISEAELWKNGQICI